MEVTSLSSRFWPQMDSSTLQTQYWEPMGPAGGGVPVYAMDSSSSSSRQSAGQRESRKPSGEAERYKDTQPKALMAATWGSQGGAQHCNPSVPWLCSTNSRFERKGDVLCTSPKRAAGPAITAITSAYGQVCSRDISLLLIFLLTLTVLPCFCRGTARQGRRQGILNEQQSRGNMEREGKQRTSRY